MNASVENIKLTGTDIISSSTLKDNSIELFDVLLENNTNKIALIEFNSESTIIQEFTNDKETLINKINSLDANGGTNYNQALQNLDVMLGIESRVIFDIQDVINGVVTLNKALVRDKRIDNLYLLPACKSIDVTKINFSYLEKIIVELKKEFDFIVAKYSKIEKNIDDSVDNRGYMSQNIIEFIPFDE